MNKRPLLIIALLIILAGFFIYRVKIKLATENLFKEKSPKAVEYLEIDNNKIDEPKSISANEANDLAIGFKDNKLPASINLNVPFTPQAPEGDWDEILKEACEETVALMVDYYYKNKKITPQTAGAEILKMVDWQNKNFGGHFDLTALETIEMIKNHLGYKKVEIIENPTIENIKNEISAGRPIIMPAAGQLLGNPYFRTPGPIYHMLVIKGYVEDKFIANDPGTKRGKNYFYSYQTIMEALHDWNNGADIRQGARRIIVVYPN